VNRCQGATILADHGIGRSRIFGGPAARSFVLVNMAQLSPTDEYYVVGALMTASGL
jgi:hypothetical protein